MRMYQVIELSNLYNVIKDHKLNLKTAYKLNRLMRQVDKEIAFYQERFQAIVNEYADKDADGNYKFTEDRTSIAIIPGKESECNIKLNELRDLEVDLSDTYFTLEELEGLNLTLAQMDCFYPLIKE